MPIFTQDTIRQNRSLEEFETPFIDYVGAKFSEGVDNNITSMINQRKQLTEAETGQPSLSDYIDPANIGVIGQVPVDVPDAKPVTHLEAAEARSKIKDAGVKLTVPDTGISADALQILIDRQKRTLANQDAINRSPSGMRSMAGFSTSLVAGMLDPLNVGAAFVPVIGEARITEMMAKSSGMLGRTATRAGIGAVEGTAGMAMLEPFNYALHQSLQDDYHMTDSLLNIAFGGVMGGGLHVVGGLFGEALSKNVSRETLMSEIPRAQNLSEAHRAVESNLANMIDKDLPGVIKKYNSIPDTAGGKVINTDLAREISPEYAASKASRSELSAAVHEPASYLTKEIYAQKLAEAPKEGERNLVVFTAGGTGAGKSTAIENIKAMRTLKDSAQIIYDTNMNNFKSSVQKIDQAIAAGKNVSILYVNRDPIAALVNGALPRAERMGRTVPLAEHAKTHAGSSQVIHQLADHYKGNDKVNITVIDNNTAKGKQTVANIASVQKQDYNELVGRLRSALDEEYKNGKISENVYSGTAGRDAAQGSIRGAETNAGRSGQESNVGNQPQDIRQSVRGGSGGETQNSNGVVTRSAADVAADLSYPTRVQSLKTAIAQATEGRIVDVEPVVATDPSSRIQADIKSSAERQAMPEAVRVADVNASREAQSRIADAPKSDDLIAAEAELRSVLDNLNSRVDPEKIKGELSAYDEAIKNTDDIGKALQAAAGCAMGAA